MSDAFSDAQRDAQEIAARRRNATRTCTGDRNCAATEHVEGCFSGLNLTPAPTLSEATPRCQECGGDRAGGVRGCSCEDGGTWTRTLSEEGGEHRTVEGIIATGSRAAVDNALLYWHSEAKNLLAALQASREENSRNWNSGYKAGQEQMEDELQAAREENAALHEANRIADALGIGTWQRLQDELDAAREEIRQARATIADLNDSTDYRVIKLEEELTTAHGNIDQLLAELKRGEGQAEEGTMTEEGGERLRDAELQRVWKEIDAWLQETNPSRERLGILLGIVHDALQASREERDSKERQLEGATKSLLETHKENEGLREEIRWIIEGPDADGIYTIFERTSDGIIVQQGIANSYDKARDLALTLSTVDAQTSDLNETF